MNRVTCPKTGHNWVASFIGGPYKHLHVYRSGGRFFIDVFGYEIPVYSEYSIDWQ